jgi:OmcA/MtrC family decaheme c-type cytochrome
VHDQGDVLQVEVIEEREQPPLVIEVDAVSLTTGRAIQIDFTVTVNGAPRDILTTPLTSLSAVVAGPTTDYLFNTSFTLTSASAGTLTARDAAMGQFRWVSATTVDAIAAAATADPLRGVPGVTITTEGTWAIGMQATLRVNGTATTTSCSGTSTTTCGTPPTGGSWQCVSSFCTEAFTYPSWNPVAYLALTGTTPVPRREVVAIDRCNGCHERLEIHGGGRNDPEYCVMCHSSTFDTADRMPIPTGGTARTMSVSMATFIHRIHTGGDGVSPVTYWAPRPATPINAGGRPVDFSHVEFPADRRECQVCHVSALDLTTMLSLRPARTRTLNDTRGTVETFWRGATAAACLGCHDDGATAAHAASMTTPEGESCAVCHEAGAEFGIDTVHSRPEYDLR